MFLKIITFEMYNTLLLCVCVCGVCVCMCVCEIENEISYGQNTHLFFLCITKNQLSNTLPGSSNVKTITDKQQLSLKINWVVTSLLQKCRL